MGCEYNSLVKSIAVMKIANDREVLRNKTNSHISNAIGWLTLVIMGISVVIMFVTWGKQ